MNMLVLVKDTYSEHGIHEQLLTMNYKKSGKKTLWGCLLNFAVKHL